MNTESPAANSVAVSISHHWQQLLSSALAHAMPTHTIVDYKALHQRDKHFTQRAKDTSFLSFLFFIEMLTLAYTATCRPSPAPWWSECQLVSEHEGPEMILLHYRDKLSHCLCVSLCITSDMVLVVLIFCQLSVAIVLVCYAALTPIQYESLPLIGVMIVIAVNKQDHRQ